MNKKYERQINDFLSDYDLSLEKLNLDNLHIVNNELYQAKPELMELASNFKNVSSVGLFMGEFGHQFKPSFNFLDVIGARTRIKSTIRKEKEFLFLCGRDLKEDAFKGKTKGKFIVTNKENLVLGIVKKVKSKSSTLTKTFFRNVIDKGIILRREFTRRPR